MTMLSNFSKVSRCLPSSSSFRLLSSVAVPEIALESDQLNVQQSPTTSSRQLNFIDKYNKFQKVPQTWVTTLDQELDEYAEIIQLHPDVFRTFPRLDILKRNLNWQNNYRQITYIKALNRAEMPGTSKKPWPQKGTGRARHGSFTTPQWHTGGVAHGIRGPLTHFYMLPNSIRLQGLCVALTIKHAQDDLVVVDSLQNVPTDDPIFINDLAEKRNWGYSVLFVDVDEDPAENLVKAVNEIPSFNIIPVEALNCHSIVKHHTIVLTKAAVEQIEERIMFHKHKAQSINSKFIRAEYLENKSDLDLDGDYPPFI